MSAGRSQTGKALFRAAPERRESLDQDSLLRDFETVSDRRTNTVGLDVKDYALRILLSIAGSYLLSTGLAALLAVTLAFVLPLSEAVVLMAMLAFVIYLALLIWAFAERRLFRVVVVLGVGGPLAFAAQCLVGTVV